MPHIMLEYSENLGEENNYKNILYGLHKILSGTGQFNINDFKSRAVQREIYCVGDDKRDAGFAACNISILSGRDDDTKKMLSGLVIKYLSENISKPDKMKEMNITVQISELHKPSYRRINL